MQLIREWLVNGWAVVLVLLGLGLIIFIHELGHFLMAKKNKVKVEIFSLGMLKQFNSELAGAKIDLDKTFDDRFVRKATGAN